jgi:peptidoglycan/LPS O-acetylase OafA/YrhL
MHDQRSDPGSGRILYLDGWRALAIGGVIIDHFGTSRGINLGRFGVELFFVLSGRLMAQILFVEHSELKPFYYRRFSRVWPTMATLILALMLLSWLMHAPLIDRADVISALTYTYNYASLAHRTAMIDHLWSLCVEEHTYLFLGMLALVARRFPRCLWPVLLTVIFANVIDGAVSTFRLNQDYYVAFWRTDVRMGSILMGTAAFMLKKQGLFQVSGNWPLAIGLFGLVLNTNFVPDPVKYSIGSACLAIAVANVDNATLAVKKLLSARAVVWVGVLSFSLYIWQQPFAEMLPHSLIMRIPRLAGTFACAIASYYFIERPARRWLNAHPPRWARNKPPETLVRSGAVSRADPKTS